MFLTCVSTDPLSLDLISTGNAQETERSHHFAGKGCFAFFAFKSAEVPNKTNSVYLRYCRSGLRHAGRTVSREKEKNGSEHAFP